MENIVASLNKLAARPARALALFCAVQFVFWVVLPSLVSSAPPLDVVEGLVWGREWVIGTHKHPPLPAWLIEISFQLTGSPTVGPYIVSQLCVVLTYVLVYRIGRRLTTPQNALVGSLLLVGVYYFTWSTPEFNHNIIQLPVWAGMVLAFLAVRDAPKRLMPWIVLGVVAGIGIYAKYSVVVLYAVLALWVLYERPLRAALLTPAPWLGAAAALLVAAPHLYWLAGHLASNYHFVRARGGNGSLLTSAQWLLVQAADHAPMLIVLAIVGIGRIKRLPKGEWRREDAAVILFLGLAPALLTTVGATLAGMGLVDMWGTPMFALSGLLAVIALRRIWTEEMAARVLATAIGFSVVLAVANSTAVALSPRFGAPQRSAWPMEEIATQARAKWYAATDSELKIVSGYFWYAGLVATGSPERPSVVYNGDLAKSPWISADDIARDGVLYVWLGKDPPRRLFDAGDVAVQGTLDIDPKRVGGRVLSWAVRLPQKP